MNQPSFAYKKITVLVMVIFSYYTCSAQAKLVVSGAKINMASSVYLSTSDISLTSGSTVNVASSTIKIAGNMSSSGSLDVTNGTVETNGTGAQTIPANVFFTNTARNLTVNNTAGVTMQGGLALTDVLTLGTGSLASNGYLTLKSTSVRTARVAPVTSVASVPISGDVIVERYIPAKRAFRMLTAPVKSTTGIRANWMENTNNTSATVNNDPVPGYGTHVTGIAANGFDVTNTINPSMFTFDVSTQQWVAIPNTGVLYSAGAGYRILIRGSRSTDLQSNTPPPSVTTLRAKGSLLTGTLVMAKPGGGGTSGMPQLSAATDGYSLLGNPYASVVDWNAIQKTDISTTIYIFDPTLIGANGRGAYVSYNGTFLTNSNASSVLDNNLQSGLAFFVQTTGPNPSITIKETHKASANRNVFRTANTIPQLSVQLLLPSQVNTAEAADGFLVFFSEEFPNAISSEDSYKFSNPDENIGVLTHGTVLSIEGRQPIATSDTVFMKVWQLTRPDYSFKVMLKNFDPSIQTYLYDAYLHTNTLINNPDGTIVPFKINSDSASIATERFKIVFKNASALPVELSAVKAYEKDKGIQVEWTALTESNMDRYVVEKSATGQQFIASDSVKARQNPGIASNYSWFDTKPYQDNNYYRIKSVDKSGAVKYSRIAKVHLSTTTSSVVVTDNPVHRQAVHLEIRNLKKGNYTVTLFNPAGQMVYKGTLNYNGGVSKEVIKLATSLAAGIYKLHVEGVDEDHTVSVLFN